MNVPRLRPLALLAAILAAILSVPLGSGTLVSAPQDQDSQDLLKEISTEKADGDATEAPDAKDANADATPETPAEPAGDDSAPAADAGTEKSEPAPADATGDDSVPTEEPAPAEPAPKPEKKAEKKAPVKAAAAPEEEPAPAPRSRRESPRGNDDIFRDLGLTKEARREESKELTKVAQNLYRNGELVKAEGRLAEATQLDPENTEADRLLSQVRLELGDRRGTIAETARWVSELQNVQRDQARTVIQRLLNEGKQLEAEGEYGKAAERYERAIEGIRNFHFNLNLDQEMRDAQASLVTAREKKKAKDEEERQNFENMLQQKAFAQRQESTQYLENQLRELRRKARTAEDEKDYDRAIMLYERILIVNPQDPDALRRLDIAKEQRHTHKMDQYIRDAAENFELAVLSIDESSVSYQQIFRYPDAREWQRISPKVVSIEEEIAATETTVEKEIKRKLEQPVSVGFDGDPLSEALKQLQTFSGINFVLSKEGADAGEKPVKLERFDDLPLKNVLSLLLATAGEDFTYAIKEGAVVIGPKASLKKKEYLRFYEISDLIQEHPDFKAPPLALDELKGKNTGGGSAIDIDVGDNENRGTRPLGAEKLLELIKKELGGEGAEAEGVSILGGKLSARTSLENHLKLSNLLAQFRRATGLMITVESRFLDIQDNFLEEIGVNLGNPNANFLPNNIPDIDGAGTSISPGWEWVSSSGQEDVRWATIGQLSQPLGTKVNPFNISSSGGGAYQLNVLKAESYQLEAILTAVAKEQEIRKLNSPRVTAFNGQVAHTLVVNQAAYIQDLEVNQTGVIPVINPVIDVLNSGSILEVRPTVSHDRKYVVLEIQPTLAERLTPDVAVLNLSGNFTVVPIELPVLSVTKIKTTVTVPDGGTVLVGGLKREISNKEKIGIPGLLDIPFVNLLFGRIGQSNVRSNLFVLINSKITIVHEEEARLFGT
jgi:Flp pilus assembly secretin CpaC/tetratricopeptide (TPR) repeat protein